MQIDIKNQKEQNEPIDMFPTTIPMLIQRAMGFGGNQEGGIFYTCKLSSSRADEDSLKLEVRRGKNEHATSTVRVTFLTLAATTSTLQTEGSTLGLEELYRASTDALQRITSNLDEERQESDRLRRHVRRLQFVLERAFEAKNQLENEFGCNPAQRM